MLADLTQVAYDAGHTCNGVPTCDHTVELLAAELLRRSCLTPLGYETIADLPHASDVLRYTSDVCFDEPVVLTSSRMRHLLDQVPGGTAFYDRVGYRRLRAQLLDDPRFDRTTLGAEALEPLLTDPDLPGAAIDAANRLLSDQTGALAVIRTALAAAIDAEERAAFLTFLDRSSLDASTVNLPLYLPRRSKTVVALRQVGPVSPVASDLLDVLDPSAYQARTAGVVQLRDLVYEELAAASGLPRVGAPARTNRSRLAVQLGQSPDPYALRAWPQLRDLLAGAIGQGKGRAPANVTSVSADDTAGLATLRDVFTLLERHVTATGRLPSLADLGPTVLARVEQLTGCTYRVLARRLASQRGWPLPARSRNEQQLDALLSAAYGTDGAVPASSLETVVEWSSRDLLGGTWRIDTYAHVTPTVGRPFELFCEADGQGHFEEVRNWDLDACRRRDIAKADALARLTGPARDGMLLAVHHALLTGRSDDRLDPATFAAIVADARAAGVWWVFLAPPGSTQLRAAPMAPHTLEGSCDRVDVWVLTDRPDDTTSDDER